MIQQAETLYDQLEEKLREVETMSSVTPVQRHETNLKLLNETIQELKQLVISYSFPCEEEEIKFFRYIKPRFTSLLIYHSRMALLELRLALASPRNIREYYENELQLIRNFINDHSQFYHYLYSGATFLDSKYFVRGSCDFPLCYSVSMLSTSTPDTDSRFTTHYDYIAACFQANEKLRDFFLKSLMLQDAGISPENLHNPEKSNFSWTGCKTHLVELAYALYESGQINSGTAGVMEIVERLAQLFQVDLGNNIYRTFQEIRQRKKDSRTKLLDLMKERLLRRMDELDDA
ncbi:RteC domain-containing protein [Botryobacter ruber]|uniref:RteC domain-containing protein n=1 Tax=Botryobacter ruber TaxID=2171629 RepID=UPI000E0AED2F|nr:RteC domain-containing protein [Botryobacter ruber]